MKIIQITASYKPAYVYGGPIMSVSMLCEALEKYAANADVEVLTTSANGKDELEVSLNQIINVDGVKVTYYPRITKDHTHFSPALLANFNRKMTYALGSKTARKKPLVVHIHAWWNLVSILTCQLAKWKNVVVILSPRGMLTHYTLGNKNVGIKSIIHQTVGKRLLKYCHIHATSEQERIDILQFVQPKSITVIPNLVHLGQRNPAAQSEKRNCDHLKLIFLSRIDEKKGLENLFDALSRLTIDWSLSIAGSGKQQYIAALKQQTIDLQMDTKVSWLGHVANDQKFDFLAAHDLLVLISQNENFANVVIESLSVGTPVLISESVGLSTYVQTNKVGWVTSPTVNDISTHIEKIAIDQSARNLIRENAPKLIKRDFDEKNLIDRYIALYEKALISS